MNSLNCLVLVASIVAVASSFPSDVAVPLQNEISLNTTTNTLTSIIVKFQDKEYEFVIERGNYFEAFVRCQERNARLASIDSEEANNLIQKTVLERGYRVSNGMIFWTSGFNLYGRYYYWYSNGKRVTYTNWAPGEPNNLDGNENCIQVADRDTGALTWNDDNCLKSFYYICEK